MPRIECTVAGQPVRLIVLPRATPKMVKRFRTFGLSDDIFGLDVESTSIDDDLGVFDPGMRLRMVQFGSSVEAWALDPHDTLWRAEIESLLSANPRDDLCESAPARFVSHTNYDPLWIRREFHIDLGERSLDTLPMASLLHPGPLRPKNLKHLSDIYIDTGLSEAEDALHARFKELAPVNFRVGKKMKAWGFTNIALDDPVFGQYAGLDAIYVRRLLDILARLLKAEGMAKLAKREQRIQRMATDQQIRGMRVDLDYTNALLDDIAREYAEADEWLRDLWGFSPRSPKRSDWLQERGVSAGVDGWTQGGALKLDKETIPEYAAQYASTELGDVFAHMKQVSERSNLLSNLTQILSSVDDKGYVHPKINTNAGVTGRMSIVRPAMQTFKNPKNVAPEDQAMAGRLRGCFITPDGELFVGADYDSQETRLALAFSKDKALHKIIFDGVNMHDMTAEMIFGPKYDAAQRFKSKTLDFAQQYGAMPKKIAMQLGISIEEAKKLWLAWRVAYAGLVKWTKIMERADEIVNPFGRVIPADRRRRYANGNYAIQSTGRDVLGFAECELQDRGWAHRIWLPVHDEIVLSVPEAEVEEAKRVLEESMTMTVLGVPLTTEAKVIGRRWNGTDSLAVVPAVSTHSNGGSK